MNTTTDNCKFCNSSEFTYRISGPHLGQYCSACDRWQKWINQDKPIELMPFGKYKDRPISEIQDKNYLTWLVQNLKSGQINYKNPEKLINAIENRLTL